MDPYRKGHTGTIYDERILEALGVDVRFLVFNLENYGVKEWISEDKMIDEWGCWMLGRVDFLTGILKGTPEVEAFLDKVMETQIAYYKEFLKIVGPYIDIVETLKDSLCLSVILKKFCS